MEERKQPLAVAAAQDDAAVADDDYGHLMAHLIDAEPPARDTNEWTRVLSRENIGDKLLPVHRLGSDLIADEAIRDTLAQMHEGRGEVVFSPMLFRKEDLASDLEASALKEGDLHGLAQVATNIRKRFTAAAQAAARAGVTSPPEVPRLRRTYTRGSRDPAKLAGAFDHLAYRESVGRKRTRRHQLSSDEVFEILDTVRKQGLAQREAAARFNVSARLVSGLVVADRKVDGFRQQDKEREEKRRHKLRVVLEHSLRRLVSWDGLSTAAELQRSIEDEHGLQVKHGYVCGILRHDIGARFQRVKRVPHLGNSTRCLLLRQHYAKFMLA